MREGIYINHGPGPYTGFVVFFYKKLQIIKFTSCTLPHIVENIAKSRILPPITSASGCPDRYPNHPIPVYRIGEATQYTAHYDDKDEFRKEYYSLLTKFTRTRQYLGAGKYEAPTEDSLKISERLGELYDLHPDWADTVDDEWGDWEQKNKTLLGKLSELAQGESS